MRRRWKIAFSVLAAISLIILALGIGGLYLVRSGFLKEQVRQRIIAEAERSTGGKVEIGNFLFDWRTLTAELDGFIIHGTEPPASPPLLKIEKLVVQLKIISLIEKNFEILSTRLDSPSVFLLIGADGSTNIPAPKVHPKPEVSPAETILDLKIHEFAISNATVEVHAAGQAPKVASYHLAGRNLQSKFNYRADGPKYAGNVSVQSVNLKYGDYRPIEVNAELTLAFEKNRVQVTSAKVSTASSHIDLSGDLQNFTSPVIDTKYTGEISLTELAPILKLNFRPGGVLALDGNFHYAGASEYVTTGNLRGRNLALANPTFPIANASAATSYRIDPKAIELTNLTAALLGGTVSGRVVLKDLDRYEVSGRISHFDIAKLAKQQLPYDGLVDGPFTLSGRLSDSRNQHLNASAKLNISPSPSGPSVNGFVDARYDASLDQIVLAPSHVVFPNSRLDLRGVFGQRMQVVIDSHDFNDFLPALAFAGQKEIPVTLKSGSAHFDGSVIGALESPRIEGHLSATNFVYSGELVDSLSADLSAQDSGVTVRSANLVYQQVRTTFQVSVGLQKWKPYDAAPLSGSASLKDAGITGLLALAGRKDIPVTGSLSISGQVTGTVANPQAAATFSLVKGIAYSEPFDRITGKLESAPGGNEQLTAQLNAGSRQINTNARYQHAPGDFRTGQLNFKVTGNRLPLAQFANIRKAEPGLAGTATLNAAGDLSISPAGFKIVSLNADLATTGITLDARQLSDLKLTARTEAGFLKTHIESNLAQAQITGDGSWALSGNYPGSAQINFSKIDLAVARKLFMPASGPQSFTFGGQIEGQAMIAGDLLKPEAMTANLEIPLFELKPGSGGPLAKEISDFTIRNTQTIRIRIANSLVRVESARFSGPNTDLALLGSVDLKAKEPLSLNLNGNLDLKIARTFNADVDSSGNLLVRVTLSGTFENPRLGGLADLRNGNLSIAGFPNGLSRANGRITFDENRANIESLNAETGGGTIQLTGFAAFGGPSVSFRVAGIAKGVRVRYPEGVSSVSDANITWTGSTERSLLSGDVTVHKVAYNQQSDLGSVLSLTGGGPAPTQAVQTGLIGGTQFDVRVQTAADVSLQTGLVSGLRTEANLRLRGTLANPSLLGRITISSGTLNFLGNKYTIDQGTISFFNPVKIDPIVNVDLQTQARGVDVTLTISGPLTKLNVTYRSDPPLQFSDIVGLLATGKTPSDPTIAARQTDTQQNWQQLGASALVGQAIANPVSGRLQRFFGVSRLKIDPLLPGLGGSGSGTGGSNPGARLSLEQQVGPNVTFDYVISTNSTSSQVVRVEWALSKNWSAVAIREENSAFGIDFQYKKRFK